MWLTLLADEEASRPLFGLELAGKRQRAVFELLLVEANRRVSVDRIIDQVWPEKPPKTARNSVQRFVADIRKALGENRDRLKTVDDGYVLRLEAGEIDIDDVYRLRNGATRLHDDPERASAMLRDALNHFGSLGRVAYTEAGQEALRSHEELQLQILEECIELQIAAGNVDSLVEELDALTSRHPYRERFWGQLVRVLASTGRRVEALRSYELVRRTLIDDVGLEPSQELREIHAQVLADPDVDERILEPQRPAAVSTPRMPASLIGRRADFDRVCALLNQAQLVTIAGPGGVGKTTLARAVADAVDPPAGHPAAMVRLAEVQAGGEVAGAVASAIGLELHGSSSRAVEAEVIEALARSPRLVVLDNAEHVVETTASFTEKLLARTESPVVVTSRQRLGLIDEWLHPLRGLTTPDGVASGASESEELFVRRAAALGVDVSAAAAEVATVCSVLDGLPLAIELVAGQLEHLGLHDVVDGLDSLLDIRAARAANERHASLAALLQWSWDLLSADEAELLELLAVFAGRLDAAASRSIAGERYDMIAALVSKNLVTATVEDGRAYYSLPKSVRAFANGKAREGASLAANRNAHADYVLAYLRQWSIVELNAWHDTIDAAARYQAEYGVALEWLDQCDRHDDLIELATRTTGLWGRRGPRSELLRWSRRCAEIAEGTELPPEVAAGVTVMGIEAAFRFANYDAMARLGDQLERSEASHPTDIGTPLLGFYGTALHSFDLGARSRTNVEVAHDRAPSTKTAELNVAQTRMWLGSTQLMNRDFDSALMSYRSVLEITTRPGGTVLWAELGSVACLLLLGRHREAEQQFAQRTSGADDSVWNYATLVVGAVLQAALGEPDKARHDLVSGALARIAGRSVAARNDFQVGFGIVAMYAGDERLASELLADPIPQSPVMTALLFNHLYREPMSAEQWQQTWTREMASRLVTSTQVFAPPIASVEQDLRRWWPTQPTGNEAAQH